ncbi:DctP family TRAP transporter solute-binding subunit [Propionivibrio limicola]|uniref:DctP family TRAP transporter solute-binding subunit n=1 Tax=Propionivibrio limicola TaxID=167645 RepID=UPI0012909371|nr:DctP family TRAP transporter solute-binding subunit [Propionivibrio limicola]
MRSLRRLLNVIIPCLVCLAAIVPGAARSAPEIQERIIRFGHLNNHDHPVSLGVKRFTELLAQKSGGKMTVFEYTSSSLGDELQQQAALQSGVQEMSAPSTSSLSGIAKEFGLLDLPFAVSSFAQADALLDGPFGQSLQARLPGKGLVALGFWDLGFRNMTNNERPITRVEDFEGLTVRIIPSQVFAETFRALDATPVPMPFSRLYDGLMAGTVNAQENPFAVIQSNKIFQVQKYLSGTNHVYAANIILVGKRFWDKLSRTEKRIMIEAANESRVYQRRVSRDAAQRALAELQKGGMVYNELAPAEQTRLRAFFYPLIERFTASYDPAIVQLYNTELVRIRKQFPQ